MAGYSVVELNASDERSGETTVEKISGALHAKYDINTKKRKPMMLVIDEIDGALAGSSENVSTKTCV